MSRPPNSRRRRPPKRETPKQEESKAEPEKGRRDRGWTEEQIDEALAESFPASDPPAFPKIG
jgi:hypothetical protein